MNYIRYPHTKFDNSCSGTNGKALYLICLRLFCRKRGIRQTIYITSSEDFRERIRINGKLISKIAVIDGLKQLLDKKCLMKSIFIF